MPGFDKACKHNTRQQLKSARDEQAKKEVIHISRNIQAWCNAKSSTTNVHVPQLNLVKSIPMVHENKHVVQKMPPKLLSTNLPKIQEQTKYSNIKNIICDQEKRLPASNVVRKCTQGRHYLIRGVTPKPDIMVSSPKKGKPLKVNDRQSSKKHDKRNDRALPRSKNKVLSSLISKNGTVQPRMEPIGGTSNSIKFSDGCKLVAIKSSTSKPYKNSD